LDSFNIVFDPMNAYLPKSSLRLLLVKAIVACLVFGALLPGHLSGQSFNGDDSAAATAPASSNPFRLERTPVDGGAELLTVFGRLDGLSTTAGAPGPEVPLVAVLRDTFGDNDPENDRLRYLWTLTYTRPSLGQRLAGAIPFLYSRVGNKTGTNRVPPAVLDLGAPDQQVWERFFWAAIQRLVLDSYGTPIKATTRTYRQNLGDYRKAHVMRALAVLSLYQNLEKQSPVLTDAELRDIQARLALDPKTLGGIVDDIRLPNYARKENSSNEDIRGHNWELLRQYSEAEGLYFDPLTMPDGSMTHALVWVSRSDLDRNRGRKFNKRFLNFADPWTDERLRHWDGYTERRYFDAEGRQVPANTEGARTEEFIPLALYGLDYPKIPIMLVDFRDRFNPKKREMSRRVLDDVARNVIGLSSFGNIPYFVGRFVYDFVTGRRGMDLNQPSRLKSYSQLKLLISLNDTLDPQFRETIANRLEDVSLNPMENDMRSETKLAQDQYAALLDYLHRPDGMPKQLALDRRAEMVPLRHGKAAQAWFRIANLATFGAYTHRENTTPELVAQLDVNRRLDFHGRFLREVAKSPRIEVAWNVPDVVRSLEYVASNGSTANGKVATAIAQIFRRTDDLAVRRLCVDSLYRINNERAKAELLALYQTPVNDPSIKDLTANYLRQAVREDMRISRADFRAIVNVIGQ
jgi:hypothetical protein